MKIELSWALGFKLFTILYGMGLIGSMLLPSHERTEEPTGDQHPVLEDPVPQPANSKAAAMPTAASEPMTRAVLESIYFDVVRATGQGEQLQVELQAYNTGPDRSVIPGRPKGILRPALFAAVFDEQGRKWSADHIQVGNAASTPGFLLQTKLISGVPATILLTFARMPAIAGELQIRTISRLEVPMIVGGDEHDLTGQEQPVVLVFSRIPVASPSH